MSVEISLCLSFDIQRDHQDGVRCQCQLRLVYVHLAIFRYSSVSIQMELPMKIISRRLSRRSTVSMSVEISLCVSFDVQVYKKIGGNDEYRIQGKGNHQEGAQL